MRIVIIISVRGNSIDKSSCLHINIVAGRKDGRVSISPNKRSIIAGGAESMSYIPMGGYKPVPDYKLAKEGHEDYYWGMGLTAEAVANQYKVSREDQDEFAYNSHQKAIKAQAEDRFQDQIVPITIDQTYVDGDGKKKHQQT